MFMAPEVPTILLKKDFDLILNATIEDDDKKFFAKCYKETNDIYHLKKKISDQERWILVGIYINSGVLIPHINHMIIAHYFYSHGLSCGRNGNEYDDYYKSLYLCSLFPYLREKKTRCVSIENSEQMDELLCMVNNIYDRSFFLKKTFPEKSDIECFTESERHFCEEKWVDCQAYYEYEKRMHDNTPGDEKTDYEEAKKKFRLQKIKEMAFYKYQDRVSKNMPLDPDADYLDAEKQWSDETMTERFAEFCWNKHHGTLSKECYWSLGEEVLAILQKEHYDFPLRLAQDKHIHKIVDRVVAAA
jgi:hypothetical protein